MKILTNRTAYFFKTEHDLDFFIRMCGHMIDNNGMIREIYMRNNGGSAIAFNFSNRNDGLLAWKWSRVRWYKETSYKVITFKRQRSELL